MTPTDPQTVDDSEPGERQLTLTPDQALALAIERHQRDDLDNAEAIYAALLERWPDHADALTYMGVLQHQRGAHAAALALLRHAVDVAPEVAGIWNNLGNVLKQMREDDEAEGAFRRSIALAESPQALSNLGSLLRRRGQWAQGEAACRRAIEMAPAFGDAWHHLTLLLIAQERIDDAVAAARQATALLPPHQRHRGSYTRALVNAGHVDAAVVLFREWLAEDPDNAYARHHLAACLGEGAPERASDAYVEQSFDEFAASFDDKLERLGYRAPALVADALAQILPAPARQFEIADLGCGTGLCGPLIAPWARRLSGCDLSAGMLERAARRGVYDALEKAELLAYLDARRDAFDVVVSADTLCYFGSLATVAASAHAALRAGGELVFTVEALLEDDAADVRLMPHGRYAHGRGHVEAVLTDAGFSRQRIVADVLRTEGGQPVHGWLVSAGRD